MLMPRWISYGFFLSLFACAPAQDDYAIPQVFLANPAPLSITQLDTAALNTVPTDSLARIIHLRTNPAHYNLLKIAADSLHLPAIPLHQKLIRVGHILSHTKPYYQMAQYWLTHPDIDFTKQALRDHLAALHFLDCTLTDSLSIADLPPNQRHAIDQHRIECTYQIKLYLAYCRSILFEHRDKQLMH
jgi:hypothetical protein